MSDYVQPRNPPPISLLTEDAASSEPQEKEGFNVHATNVNGLKHWYYVNKETGDSTWAVKADEPSKSSEQTTAKKHP